MFCISSYLRTVHYLVHPVSSCKESSLVPGFLRASPETSHTPAFHGDTPSKHLINSQNCLFVCVYVSLCNKDTTTIQTFEMEKRRPL